MARTRKKNANTRTARKIQRKNHSPFRLVGLPLVLLGKPLFLVIEYTIIGSLLFLEFVGQLPEKLYSPVKDFFVKKINQAFTSKNKRTKKKTLAKKKVSKTKLGFTFPRLRFPKFDLSGIWETQKLLLHLQKKNKKAKPAKKKVVKKVSTKPRFVLFEKLFQFKIHLPKLTFSRKFTWLKLTLIFLVLLLFGSFYYFVLYKLPSPSELITRDQDVSTKIYDRNGVLLYKIYKDKNRTPVELNKIPMHVRYATLAAEDAEFYSHPGFSIRGIARSIYKNTTEGELTGGSTITQQLVKNALLSSEKTLVRKIREVILSVETELTFSKDQILEMYLNEVSYGGAAYGIQEAAQVYFGKNVEELTLGEAALLAGLPKSPTKYYPFGSNSELAKARQKDVLNLMVVNGYITQEQADEASQEELKYMQKKTEIKAPHFVMYVREQLVEEYGEEVVERGGLEVYTTLDYEIQKLAESAVKTEVEKLSRLNVGNGAAVVLNPKTGEILAMVGSKDYFDTKNDGNVNVTTRLRPPGSSIKVLNYAYALTQSYTPASIIDDKPMSFAIPGQTAYVPKNYDSKFRGKITLRSALAESRNIPAVAVLASYGVDKMIDLGEKMGITTWGDRSRFGLSLTLGGGETRLIEMAQLFGTIANYGEKSDLLAVTKITNYKGQVIKTTTPQTTPVLDPRVAYQLTDILKDNTARTPAFGSRSALVVANHPEVAVKTGTSNDLRDNLTIGYNQDYVVAVWVGNNNNAPMSRIASGITGAAPIWNKIITSLLSQTESRQWEVPDGLVRVPVCTLTGTLPCNGCPGRYEWFLVERSPKFACKRETIEKINDDKKKKEEVTFGQITPFAASTVN